MRLLIFAFSFLPALGALALDPLPIVEEQPGYRTWTLEGDRPRYRLEDLMADLRSTDRWRHEGALKGAGFEKERVHSDLRWPELEEPIEVHTKWLGWERRKMAALTAPARGRGRWYMIVLRQEGDGELYWRPVQAFVFDTDPVKGFKLSFEDINGEQTYFAVVRHKASYSIQGQVQADSILRFDEKRLRLCFQEIAELYRPGTFQGMATRQRHALSFPGDQTIVRKVTVESFPYMRDEEFEKYLGVEATAAKPAKVAESEERFSWNPLGYDFYHPEQELEKLVRSSSALIRRDAAKRLGEALKSTHPQIEAAMLKDPDPYVRMQCALALAAIGDPKALKSVEKAQRNWDEPDTVREALDKAYGALGGAKKKAALKKPKKKAKKAEAAVLPELKPEEPQIAPKKL